MLDLEPIRARAEKATKGPWEVGEGPYGYDDGIVQADVPVTFGHGVIITNSGRGGTSPKEEDADFIAHAREDIPALITEVEQLRAKMDRLMWVTSLVVPEIHCRFCMGRKDTGHKPDCPATEQGEE